MFRFSTITNTIKNSAASLFKTVYEHPVEAMLISGAGIGFFKTKVDLERRKTAHNARTEQFKLDIIEQTARHAAKRLIAEEASRLEEAEENERFGPFKDQAEPEDEIPTNRSSLEP